MATEDEKMMARISQLAGQINRHKYQQALAIAPYPNYSPYHRTFSDSPGRRARIDGVGGIGSTNGWSRAASFAARGRGGLASPVYRNRSLVLNGATTQAGNMNSHVSPESSASPSWLTKNGWHSQLNTSNLYERDAQSRGLAIERAHGQNEMQKDQRERARLQHHLSRMANSVGSGLANNPASASHYEVVVQGIRFVVAKNGSKLVRVQGLAFPPLSGTAPGRRIADGGSDDGISPKVTPKLAVVGGVKFYRSKTGNLYRHGVVKAHRYVSRIRQAQPTDCTFPSHTGAVKKVDEPCKIFSMTGNCYFPPPRPETTSTRLGFGKSCGCPLTRLVGSCPNGPRCRYLHDPCKVAACKHFLQQGECLAGDACDLSHDMTPERTPHCLHFVKDNCLKPNCRYTHVKVSPAALVCRPFGLYGYCAKGSACAERHVYECPDFSNTGVCKSKACKLPHRERASVLRKATRHGNNGDAMEEDLSSDDGESVDSCDVDSDAVDEFIGQDDSDDVDVDILQQRDFISL